MLAIYSLLLVCTVLAYSLRRYLYTEVTDGLQINKISTNGMLIRFLLIAILVWFAGLRTVMNDTSTYLYSFRYRIPDNLTGLLKIDWSIGSNPLFHIYQILLKTMISDNGQVLIFVTACIVEISFVRFILKYSEDAGFSIYMFLAFTVYAFTMAAMKQTLATAIAIWAMPDFIKGKWVKAFVLIALAMLIHPYVVILAVAFFLANKGVWNRMIGWIIIGTVFFSVFFYQIMGQIVSTAELLGDEYELDWFAAGTGVGVLRILAYLLPSVLAFISRGELRRTEDPLQHLFVNLTVIASCLSFLSGFGGSVLFGRLPNYFDVFICISFPFILHNLNRSLKKMDPMIKLGLMSAFFIFYRTYYNKYFSGYDNPWTADIYQHTSILSLFQR